MFKIIKIVVVTIKWLKSFCCYNSHEVLYGGCIYNLYVGAVVVLAWYNKEQYNKLSINCAFLGSLYQRYKTCYIYEVKVKFTLEQATKAHRGSRGIVLLFL
jgi:hypothetical protein